MYILYVQTSVWADVKHWKMSFCTPLLKAVEVSKDEHQRIFDGVLNEEKGELHEVMYTNLYTVCVCDMCVCSVQL